MVHIAGVNLMAAVTNTAKCVCVCVCVCRKGVKAFLPTKKKSSWAQFFSTPDRWRQKRKKKNGRLLQCQSLHGKMSDLLPSQNKGLTTAMSATSVFFIWSFFDCFRTVVCVRKVSQRKWKGGTGCAVTFALMSLMISAQTQISCTRPSPFH